MVSDRVLKENIRPIEDVDALFKLQPMCYNMIGAKKKQYGFIAQDVEETDLNHIVYKNDSGKRSVSYTQLIAILVAHIQSLTKRVADLEGTRNKLAPF